MNHRIKLINKITNEELACLNCKSKNLIMRGLGVGGAAWQVMFGQDFFGKSEIVGIACEDCGVVFLMLKNAVEDRS